MKKLVFNKGRRWGGLSIPTVLVLAGGSLIVVAAMVGWSTTTTKITARQNVYDASAAAAEAATELVIANISKDFQTLGPGEVYNKVSEYRQLVPTVESLLGLVTETIGGLLSGLTGTTPTQTNSNVWKLFEFSNAQGQTNKTHVDRLTEWNYAPLKTRIPGLSGYTSTYRIIANARQLNSPNASPAAIRQEVQIAAVPLFGFQVFYQPDLEINPGSDLTLSGPVHCNNTIYLQPGGASLVFQAPVTASRKIEHRKKAGDPVSRTPGTISYQAGRDMRLNTFNLPLGTNASSSVLHKLIEVPPGSESRTSLLGQQRYYNKADLLLLVGDTGTIAKSGAYNNFMVTLPWSTVSSFLKTNESFYNKREGKRIEAVEIDIAQFRMQYTTLTTLLGRSPKIVYIADRRTQRVNTQSGVRVVNGQTLPSAGLTIATLNPLYIQGHYNAPSNLGTTNTSTMAPASLICDALTILSPSWSDQNGNSALSSRKASSTTINAAVMGGIVGTGNGYYSGGAENFLRLLEDWSGDTLTFNGCMAALYESQTATAPWGASADVYETPNRNYGYDWNFKTPTKLPPGTPELRTLLRTEWAMIQPNTVQ